MSTVIVVTNFSISSRNALDYTCAFLNNPETKVLLVSIFSFPGSYSNDGVSMAAVSETIVNDERRLREEYEWVRSTYPLIKIETEITTGTFLEALEEKVEEENASLIVMGASGDYTDLLSWDTNIINAFIDFHVPVLVIPSHVHFKKINNIAFAINYYRKNMETPVSMIKRLIHFTKAALHVIHVAAPDEPVDETAEANKRLLKEKLQDVSPSYYEPEYVNVIAAIDSFIRDSSIDILIVLPHRKGIWHNIFHESHTKGLINLNQIPVLALHRERAFI